MIKKILPLIFLLIFAVSCSTNDKHVVVLAFSKQLHAVLYNDNSQATKTASKTYTQENDITTVADSIKEKEEYRNNQEQQIIEEKTEEKERTNNDVIEKEKPQIIKQTEVVKQEDNEILVTANIIAFDFDSYELKNEYNEGIDEICKYLNKNQDINLIIEGHSDSSGDSNYNIYLSENRAKAIFDKLVDKGIDKDRLRYIGYGSTHSSEYNDKDRKCQFVIINNSNVKFVLPTNSMYTFNPNSNEYTWILVLSPKGTSLEVSLSINMSVILFTGTDSPVIAASSTFILWLSKILQSAGIASPASKTITSPTTKSSLLITLICPSLITLEVAFVISISAEIAFSALLS